MEFLRDDPPHAWRYHAKCADGANYPELTVGDTHFKAGETNTELFFPPRDKALYKPIADAAKDMCYGRDGLGECPVRKECLLEALKRDEQHGIFGGKSHRERAALMRRKEATRPEMSLKDYVWSQEGR